MISPPPSALGVLCWTINLNLLACGPFRRVSDDAGHVRLLKPVRFIKVAQLARYAVIRLRHAVDGDRLSLAPTGW